MKRKELEVERVLTEDIVKKREVRAQEGYPIFQEQNIKEKQIKLEVGSITKTYYCELCNKQYTKISEYETHLSSYDHHHKKVVSVTT